MSEFERRIEFDPAFDRRDPKPSKDYGIHGVTLRFILVGPEGATQFVLYTNWQLPHVQEELGYQRKPLPADLGYHSPKPMYEEQTRMPSCNVLAEGWCYYDGSSLNAEPVYERLLREGHDGVWAELEDYYRSRFGG